VNNTNPRARVGSIRLAVGADRLRPFLRRLMLYALCVARYRAGMGKFSRVASFALVSTLSILLWARSPKSEEQSGWPAYGSDPGGMRYSAESQINRANVTNLKVAWTYRTGAMQTSTPLVRKAAFEATPILVDGKLFLSTPYNHVIALDPQAGTRLWEYDPGVDLNRNYSEVSSRGVSAWHDSRAKHGTACALRIFIGTLDARLIALDGNTGKVCPDFGSNGAVDLNHADRYAVSSHDKSPICRHSGLQQELQLHVGT